jgi:hypothetical protein
MAHKAELREWWRAFRRVFEPDPTPRAEPGQFERLEAARRSGDVDYLVAALTEPALRRSAARALAELEDPAALEPLVRMLKVHDDSARSAAARALGALGDRAAVRPLLEVAENDENVGVRSWAVSALGQIDDAEARLHLAAFLDDPSPSVRRAAAMSLAELGDPRGARAVDAIRRGERFTPRFLRGARPRAPVKAAVALMLAAGWIAATVAVVAETDGAIAWIGEGLVAVVFREVWLRLRERAATRLGLYSSERSVKLRWEAVLGVYLRAGVATAVVGVATSRRAVLLSTFFLSLALARHWAERRQLRETTAPAADEQ